MQQHEDVDSYNYLRVQRADEAIQAVKSGQRVFVHGGAATPLHLLRALADIAPALRNVEIVSLSTLGDLSITKPGVRESFYFNSLFVSDNMRDCVNGTANGDYIPVFLSEISRLFCAEALPLDVALIHVSPPDQSGYCSLGVSVDVALAAVRNAKYVIAQVNPRMPRTHGDGFVHVSKLNAIVEVDEPLPELRADDVASDAVVSIAHYCANLVDDGATLQLGIGAIPNAVLDSLHGHKDLGIHTEMFSDGLLPLIEKGVVTNRYKKKHPGKTVASFAMGTQQLYKYIDDNPAFSFLEASYVNDTRTIRANPNVVAINSAIEIDLTGQVCSDSIGYQQYSGVGGQMDFIRGAALSENGKPIIAMTSVTGKGKSKIVSHLSEGAGVVTTRAHVHYVITEYGTAYLFGRNLRQRALALASIAHPNHRQHLEEEIKKRFGAV